MAAIQGYNGQVRSNLLTITASRWSMDWRTDTFDVSNFTMVIPFGQYVTGLKDIDVSVDGYYETGEDPFNAGGRALVAGTTVGMRLSVDAVGVLDNLMFDLPTVLLTSVRMDTPVRDVIRVSLAGRFTDYRLSTEARSEGTPATTHA